MSHCFTYGSLMCEDIMSTVCGYGLVGIDAMLAEFDRHPVQGEDYPAIVPSAGGCVAGRLYSDVRDAAWERLDRFEGNQYQRQRVRVVLADGSPCDAWTYVFRPAYQGLLLPGDWDFAAFLREGKVRFEGRYLGFQQIEQ
ncbi:MAG: gamma-glutamylcyclotransferase [Rhodocyclaceae bacterium]|nr:gamma-glutamylcyclotransferase [Rhodocyclaceae bacterium]